MHKVKGLSRADAQRERILVFVCFHVSPLFSKADGSENNTACSWLWLLASLPVQRQQRRQDKLERKI